MPMFQHGIKIWEISAKQPIIDLLALFIGRSCMGKNFQESGNGSYELQVCLVTASMDFET